MKGSPPRRRGKGQGPAFQQPERRITPAWAGKSGSMGRTGALHQDHPRVGGEKYWATLPPKERLGSPPRGRGKALNIRLSVRPVRITPAWAGKSVRSSGSAIRCRDHPPHRRGKVQAVCPLGELAGITPAWAGKSWPPCSPRPAGEDHPRVGGEKCRLLAVVACPAGSPPRGRGKVPHRISSAVHVGITPAWAGKSLCILDSKR